MDNILSNLQAILSNGLFGITLTIVGYLIGLWLNRKFKTPILNPLLMEMLIPDICMNCLNEYFYVNMKKITVQFVKVKDVNAFINKEV